MNHAFHIGRDRLGSPQLTNPLGRLANRQVARARFAMLRFAVRRQTKPLLGSLVCFLFWHVVFELSTSTRNEQTILRYRLAEVPSTQGFRLHFKGSWQMYFCKLSRVIFCPLKTSAMHPRSPRFSPYVLRGAHKGSRRRIPEYIGSFADRQGLFAFQPKTHPPSQGGSSEARGGPGCTHPPSQEGSSAARGGPGCTYPPS